MENDLFVNTLHKVMYKNNNNSNNNNKFILTNFLVSNLESCEDLFS